MYDFDFDPETNGLELSWRDTGGEIPRREARPVKFMCVKCLAEFFGTGGGHVLRAKIEELKDNNCPLSGEEVQHEAEPERREFHQVS